MGSSAQLQSPGESIYQEHHLRYHGERRNHIDSGPRRGSGSPRNHHQPSRWPVPSYSRWVQKVSAFCYGSLGQIDTQTISME